MQINLTGKRFGRWLVLEQSPSFKGRPTLWKCQCDCGKIKSAVQYTGLTTGSSQSCGCLRTEQMCSKRPFKYLRHQRNPLWCIYRTAKTRCYNKNHPTFKRYGARGIKMCDRWLKDFDAFVDDMGEKPVGMSLDRIDNDGDYSPENCRWTDRCSQSSNRRSTILVQWRDQQMTLTQLARMENVAYHTLLLAWHRWEKIEKCVAHVKSIGCRYVERSLKRLREDVKKSVYAQTTTPSSVFSAD